MVKYLDTVGLTHLWAKIKSYVATYITNLNLPSTYVAKESGKGLSTNDYTTAEKNKLSGIAAGAEVNVQSDWNLTSSSSDAYIKNKPTNLVQDASYVHTDNNYTSTDKSKLSGIEAGAEVNLNAYSAVKVGLATLEAGSKTDTIEFEGGGDVTVAVPKPGLEQLSSKKITISVTTPKKVSDLTNDSGFITIEDVPEGVAASSTTPLMNGTAAAGTETAYSRGDHVHPTDTSRAAADHVHGNITNAGKIGSTANYAVYTTTGGAVTAGSLATTAPTASGTASAFITSVSQDSKGKISASKANLPEASTSVKGIVLLGTGTTNAAAGDHAHGNISNSGSITREGVDIGENDALVIVDNSDSSKVKKTSILFDGDTATKALTRKGTWESFLTPLTAQTAYTAKGTATKVPLITTNALGLVTTISEVTITGVTPAAHTDNAGNYGKASDSLYGHVALYDSLVDESNGGSLDAETGMAVTPHSLFLTAAEAHTGAVSKAQQYVTDQKGAANGLCPLNANTKIDASFLPSYVDDVIEAYPRANQTELSSTWLATGSASGTVITPESGKIYVLMADSSTYTANSQFRWSGTTYVKLADGGVTSITTDEIDSITSN